MTFCCISTLLLSYTGCTAIRATKLVHSGVAQPGPAESTIPFTLDSHPIFIKAQLNNSEKEYKFILDTAALTLVRQEVADELHLPEGLPVEARGSSGKSKNIDLVQLKRIKVGDMEVKECAVGVIDLSEFLPEDVAGLLGSNFLRHFVVIFDYVKKEITLAQASTPLVPAKEDIVLPFEEDMKLGFAPIIPCKIDGDVTTTAAIDTGALGITLPLSTVKQTNAYKNGDVVSATGGMSFGFAGMVEQSHALYLDTFELGEMTVQNIPATTHMAMRNHVLLGNRFLENFLVVLDYPGGELILRPNEKTPRTDTETYGLSLNRVDNRIVVAGIWENSSADTAGIAVGDEITQINGIPAVSLPMMSLMSIFMNEDTTTLDIEYRNDRGAGTATLQKRPMLPLLPTRVMTKQW